jgi:hypothetical protein
VTSEEGLRPADELYRDQAYRQDRRPPLTHGRRKVEAPPPNAATRLTDEILPKLPFFGRLKDLAYSVAGTQVAVGIMSAFYILIFQATYFGRSLKNPWDSLNRLWHFDAVPVIGKFLYDNWDTGRHIFFRDAPESVLAYALVVMVIVKIKPLYAPSPLRKLLHRLFGLPLPAASKVPFMHRVLGFLHMPTPYQRDMTGWRGKTRSADTTPLQYLFLLPSMVLAALPGEIVMAVILFGGMAIAHHQGYYSPWLEPTSPWVPIVIGISGGNAFGHLPAVKAGQDVQKYFLRMRLAIAYYAEDLLNRYRAGDITLAYARNEITALRGTEPGVWYPDVYRARYRLLKSRTEPAGQGSRLEKTGIVLFLFVMILLAGYGLYVRKWGVSHGSFWIP